MTTVPLFVSSEQLFLDFVEKKSQKHFQTIFFY